MPLSDSARIDADHARPRLVALWEMLQSLRSPIRFMQSGAHPDDEMSHMLAALAVRDGIQLSYVCSTRGEGGQNDVGTETGAALGALRTAEMERAADRLSMQLYWLSEGPEDSIADFGFSKSGEETLALWGRERTLARFAHVLRAEKPDILCPTFLDVPGQHGHHRAMTLLAPEAIAAAADPAYSGSDLPTWQVSKLLLPAWSGAGQAYDDAEPPPATFTVIGTGHDPVSGHSYARIGEQSRRFHASQGMGRWVPDGTGRDFPLHLAWSLRPGLDSNLTDGLHETFTALGTLPGADPIRGALADADSHLAAAHAAFPDSRAIARAATDARVALQRVNADCPKPLVPQIQHRIDRALLRLAHLRLLCGASLPRGQIVADSLAPNARAKAEIDPPAQLALPDGWTAAADGVGPTDSAHPCDPYRDSYDPLDPPRPVLAVRVGSDTVHLPLDHAPAVLPTPQASLSPDRLVLNLAAPQPLTTTLQSNSGAPPILTLPAGWQISGSSTLTLTPPDAVTDGLITAPLTQAGAPMHSTRTITADHIRPTALATPATLRLRILNATLPTARVAYLGAGHDRVGHWLAAIGLDVSEPGDDWLADEDALAEADSIVVGVFALRFRPALAAALPRLHAWVANGGTLLTLYHRPWDNWDTANIAPRPLEIGQPSLRWRVTDAGAEVTHLAPKHPVLTAPNRIGPEDWAGWHKERGLYFAKSWDASYTPLLAMADPGEAPHHGALLSAEVGTGRHSHCALILHHQMEQLVPGAFRLLANLVARR